MKSMSHGARACIKYPRRLIYEQAEGFPEPNATAKRPDAGCKRGAFLRLALCRLGRLDDG